MFACHCLSGFWAVIQKAKLLAWPLFPDLVCRAARQIPSCVLFLLPLELHSPSPLLPCLHWMLWPSWRLCRWEPSVISLAAARALVAAMLGNSAIISSNRYMVPAALYQALMGTADYSLALLRGLQVSAALP